MTDVRLSVAVFTINNVNSMFMQFMLHVNYLCIRYQISLYTIKKKIHVHVIFTCNIEFRRSLFIIKWYFNWKKKEM